VEAGDACGRRVLYVDQHGVAERIPVKAGRIPSQARQASELVNCAMPFTTPKGSPLGLLKPETGVMMNQHHTREG
jgi:hypothetical protein